MPLTKEQVAHLNARINSHVSYQRYKPDDPEPAAVKAAREVVRKWEKAQEDKRSARLNKVSAAKTAALEAVLSGDWPAALAAVKKFEATKF